MSEISEQLERSAGIVKRWGQCSLPNGKTFAEQLTFDGLSLWDVMAPVMALYYVPVALSSQRSPSLAQRARPHVSLAKRRVLNLIKGREYTRGGDAGWPVAPALLFIGFSAYMYRDVLQPVAERLASSNGQENVVIHDEHHPRSPLAPIDSIRAQSIWWHWDREVKNEARVLSKKTRTAIAELQSMAALPRLFSAEGESLWPQIQHGLNWLLHFHLPLLVPQVAIARRILKRHRPALIISADVADPRGRLYSLLGRQLHIPSLEIQFGPNGAEGIEWRFLSADRVAAWGETTRQALLEHGVPAQQITITGSPRHDSLVNVVESEVAKTRVRLGVPAGHAMVLCASTYQQKEYNSLSDPELLVSMKRAVFKAADLTAGLCLVVKPHPLERVQETKQLIGTARNVVLVDSTDDIRELTKACDAFIGFGSTATVDAMIAGALTICPAFPGWVWSDMFVKSDAVLVPRSEVEVLDSLRRVVDGSMDKVMAELEPARQSFLQKLAYRIDGRSSERAAAIAMEMAE